MNAITRSERNRHARPTPARALAAVALAALGVAMALPAAAAGRDRAAIEARYQAERQACLAKTDESARHNCLREAGAARHDALNGALDNGSDAAEWRRNALERCKVHEDPVSRLGCEKMALGGGETEGSVASGGEIHELTIRVDEHGRPLAAGVKP